LSDDLADRLEHALRDVYGPGVQVQHLSRLAGGASRETFRFDVHTPEGETLGLILRRDFAGRPSSPGHMTLEAAVLKAAARAGLPVPGVVLHSEGSKAAWDTAGIVMHRVDGETIGSRIVRRPQYEAARSALTKDCGRFLAGLHQLDPKTLPALPVLDAFDDCRQQYENSGMASATFDYAFRWLAAHRPAPSPRSVVHGDFRLGNLLVDDDGLRAVLDWEGVHLGDPLEDLAWLCVRAWRFGGDLPVAGVGSHEELIAAYNAAGGIDVDLRHLAWWQLFGTLRWGVLCMVQTSVHLTGAVRSVELAAIGRRVCEQEWDLLLALHPVTAAAGLGEEPPNPLGGADGLHGEPSAEELLSTVEAFLRDDLLSGLEGQVQFHTRIAANILDIVSREVLLGPAQLVRFRRMLVELGATSSAEVVAQIRAGRYDSDPGELIPFLVATVIDRLRVANPNYLSKTASDGSLPNLTAEHA